MNDEKPDRFRESTEKVWGATRKTFQTATFRAGQYGKVVQKKIDLTSLQKKISAAHTELGKMIDHLRETPGPDLLQTEGVQAILARLDGYKAEAVRIEREIEAIRAEEPPRQDEPPADPQE